MWYGVRMDLDAVVWNNKAVRRGRCQMVVASLVWARRLTRLPLAFFVCGSDRTAEWDEFAGEWDGTYALLTVGSFHSAILE